MRVSNVSDVTHVLSPVFERYNVSKAILFGSYAKDSANEQSDLDLLVDSHLRGFKFCGLMGAIHDAVGIPVDVLDVTHIEKDSAIEKEIQKTGVVIYEK